MNLNNSSLSLLDEDFLYNLQTQADREIYARIASLDMNENPIEYIEGKVTGGNISIDGSSAVRRTCSLTLVCNELNINDFYWGIRTKIEVYIGIKNKLVNNEQNVIYKYERDDFGNLLYFFQKDDEDAEYVSVYQKKENAGSFDSFSDKFEIKEYMNKYGNIISTNNCSIYSPAPKLVAYSDDYNLKNYPDIVWFRQGIFILSTFSTSVSTNNYTVSLQGKDKMCMLSGDLGGSLFASIDFGTEEEYKDVYIEVKNLNPMNYVAGKYYILNNENEYIINNEQWPYSTWPEDSDQHPEEEWPKLYQQSYEYIKKKIPLEKILKEAIHAYANEPYQNIIIKDLENYGLEQLTYKGSKTLYVLKNPDTGHFEQMAIKGTVSQIDNLIDNDENFVFDYLVDSLVSDAEEPTIIDIVLNDREVHYTVAQINYGDDIGYRLTELVYSGDLISSIGESITSVIEKIKNMLGDFEYFYDLDGRFIFQRKQIYVNTVWSQLTKNSDEDEHMINYANNDKHISFSFEGNKIISAFQNAPVLNNLKNDYVVWGKRKTTTGTDIPIHVRYAIDKKPNYYKNLKGYIYTTSDYVPMERSEEEPEPETPESFYKIPVPECLWKQGGAPGESDWWNLVNWAEWYFLQTGAYPSQRLYEYGTVVTDDQGNITEKGFVGVINFPNGQKFDNTYGSSSGVRTGQLIIDLDLQGNPLTSIVQTPGGTPRPWSYSQHGFNGCFHTYEQFLQYNALNPTMRSYIYKPQMPSQQVIDDDIEHGGDNPNPQPESIFKIVDWREIIYQMALDYFAGQGCSEDNPIKDKDDNIVLDTPDHFLSKIAENNPEQYPTGYTGYEQYYTDMQGFWRQLYNPDVEIEKIYESGHYYTQKTEDPETGIITTSTLWQEDLLTDIQSNYFVNLSYSEKLELENEINEASNLTSDRKEELLTQLNYLDNEAQAYWSVDVFNSPETLNFWFEFLDSSFELAQFTISLTGDRTKVVNDTKVTAVFYKDIPDIILHSNYSTEESNWIPVGREDIVDNSGFTFLYLPKGMEQLFTISYRGKSAKDKIDELLYQFSYCIENITITALPIYNLQPNTRIYVRDDNTKVNGEYIINRINIPLNYNGTMSINAIKAPERLY